MSEEAQRRGRNNRRRGQAGERELAGILQDNLGFAVKRNLGQERDSGHDINVPGFSIEVKRRKRVAGLYEWLEQASNGPSPTVMIRADGKDWLAVMRLNDWIQLARDEVYFHNVKIAHKEAEDAKK